MLDKEGFEFVAGCSLGDGNIFKQSNPARASNRGNKNFTHYDCYVLTMNHSAKQENYLRWKASILGSLLCSRANVNARLWKVKGKEYPGFNYTAGSKQLAPIYDLVYPGGIKKFTPELLNQLSGQALALFWMDDGCLSFSTKAKVNGELTIKDRSAMLSVCTDKEEATVVGEWVKDLVGVEFKLVPHKKSGKFYLRWTADNMRKLIRFLEPYVFPHKELLSKIDLRYGGPRELSFSASPNGQLLVNDWQRLMDDKAPRALSTLI